MINDHTLARFVPFGSGFVKPIHDDYSFALIPNTAHRLLTGETTGPLLPTDCFGSAYPEPEKVVLVFIDCFGWTFWQKWWERSRVMRSVVEKGVLTPISALFPSTTSGSVTTMNLGVRPSRHGIYEWNMYVPAFGEVIQSLPFATLGGAPGSAARNGHDIGGLFLEQQTMHTRLARHDVTSVQIAARSYAHSPYNTLASTDAEVVTYSTLAEALMLLEQAVIERPGKAFINFYWAGLDTAAHIHGPDTPVHDAEILAFWAALDALMGRRQKDGTLWLFTADHGHINVGAEKTVYINQRWPQLRGWLAHSRTGEIIWPCGSPRDMFLHIRPEHRSEALGLLQAGLAGVADVMDMAAAETLGLFGPEPLSAEFKARLGDILVLPHLGQFVWWQEDRIMSTRLTGHHGGLTREELITVLGVAHEL
ncbi:MAG: alkaline phosphatase family protein [Hyphomicrobiaceae bacterium]